MNDEQVAALIADLDSLAGLWHRSTTDDRYGPREPGYDEALKLCARQLRAALAQALTPAAPAAPLPAPAPYCATCGSTIGIFQGRGPAWRHFRGAGTTDNPNMLYETDHDPLVAWHEPAISCR